MSQEVVVSVVGARPHFVKAAPFMEAMAASAYRVFTIHTGQHYDRNMSDVFFDELGLPKPDVNLGVGSGSHATQTAAVLTGVEKLLLELKPAAVVVYGDTNTTLGAALASAKLYIPVVHVEAGVRCGNRRMPEEINRGVIDHVSDFLACPSELAVENLRRAGLVRGVHNVGDFMYDTFLKAQAAAAASDFDLERYGVQAGHFILSTLHREETTASGAVLGRLLDTMGDLGLPVLLPMHPRTRASLRASGIPAARSDGLRIIDPVGYLDMMSLLSHARLVLTDSGGLQKEAFWAHVPCVTLMRETTWTETVDAGRNVLAGLDPHAVRAAAEHFLQGPPAGAGGQPEPYGPPGAARRMVRALGWA
jgi:UDP-GlcNAc3NAcA epimerase